MMVIVTEKILQNYSISHIFSHQSDTHGKGISGRIWYFSEGNLKNHNKCSKDRIQINAEFSRKHLNLKLPFV